MKKISLPFVYFMFSLALNAQVKVYEGNEIIPTYKKGKDEVSPVFYTGRGVQGAQGKIYPYPSQTKLGDTLSNVSYEMVYLENEYLLVKVLPAFGGRLFSAIDKTNGHELFHTNSVIKPDLIGTLGAWVSGGIEWCFPHHHRTSTLMKSDYRMIENPDGSATIWIGETEKSRDLRGVVGMTLHPGKSYIEVDYRINNTNTTISQFLFWANVAVTANEDFRTFWPPSQKIGVFHNNAYFIQWPISGEISQYGRTSYERGTDLTWWRNHPNPVSFFMWDIKEGFIGGYDYSQKAGTVHVGDLHKNNASKLWQFGPGLRGQNARRKLTDDGKAYVELMTGTFSNNQPDYSWIFPHAVKDAKNYWYPIRDLEVVKNSTVDASVGMLMRDTKTIFFGFNTTSKFNNARLILKLGDAILVEKTIDIDPASPFTSTYKSRKKIDEYQLFISLNDSNGIELVSYRPYKAKKTELPNPQERVKSADEIDTLEDLYLTGRFVEQFSRPGKNPDDYYLAALDKSPKDYRSNIAMGQRRYSQMRYKEALKFLETASDKLKIKYYQPKEGELYYYKGLIQKSLGMEEEAYANFARATWYSPWFSAANYQLALLESKLGNHKRALKYIKEAYTTNNLDGRIVTTYSSLLRKSGKKKAAVLLLDKLLDYDPLNFTALYEKELLEGNTSMYKWYKNMQNLENNHLEIAAHYLNMSFYNDGIALLTSLKNPTNPLIDYYHSYFLSKLGNESGAKKAVQSARSKSLDYVFPYRPESEIVLKNAIEIFTEDDRALYLLGNLLYDNRPEEALALWQTALDINKEFPMAYRNLAFGAFYHENNPDKAIQTIKRAISLDQSIALWFSELSRYYEISDADFRENLELLENNLNVVKKDINAPKSYVSLLNLNGEYDKAIDFLGDHHFRTWEGGRETYWSYVDTHTLKARELIKRKAYTEAISHLEKALEYPENLEVGKPTHDEKNAMIYYYMGNAYYEMGDEKQAIRAYQKSANSENGPNMTDLLFYQAQSLKKLGNKEQSEKIFKGLTESGLLFRNRGSENTLIAVEEAATSNKKALSNSFYLEALGYLGLGEKDKAKQLLKESLMFYKNHLWAKNILDFLTYE